MPLVAAKDPPPQEEPAAAPTEETEPAHATEGDSGTTSAEGEVSAKGDTEVENEAEVEGPPAPGSDARSKPRTWGQKWRLFTGATRGLVTWDLFQGRLTLKAYARIQVDGTAARYNEPLAERLGEEKTNSIDLRRLDLYIAGTIDNHLRYLAGWSFGADVSLWNAYIEGIDSGLNVFGYHLGRFRAGFFQEPFSLERKDSSYYVGFVERSLPVWTFAPGNNIGYMVYNSAMDDRLSWAVGFFSFGQTTENNASNSSLSVTTRLSGRPIDRDNGRRLVHLGASYSNRTPKGSETRYASRPEARFVDFLADTGTIDSSRIKLGGLEAAAVRGPLWLQAELVGSQVTSAAFGKLEFWGSYVQAGWFLTGEVRPYDHTEGIFERVIPKSNYRGGLPFKRSNGGAVEVVGRLSNVDLNDAGVRGGKMVNLSLGLNWYIDATSRLMLDYIHSRPDDQGVEDRANIVLLRFQYRPMKR